MGSPDKDWDLDDYWYSVQIKMNGTWITEKTRIEELEDACSLAEWLKASKANSPRVRINRHETYRGEV